ncbi:MAG: hypothetical protein NTV84_02010, partial [Methanoregula sp.]|nr:hypothetical protein [Methanoregula sp.]
MENQYLSILIGFIIILLFINTTAIFSIASDQGLMSSGQPSIPISLVTSVSSSRNEVVSTSPSPDSTIGNSASVVNQHETSLSVTTPPTVSPTPVTVDQPTEVPTPVSTQIGLEIIYQTPSEKTPREQIQPAIPVDLTADYVTIYSLQDVSLNRNFPRVLFPLVNPPLVIDYEVTPVNITDIKVIDYKLMETEYHDTIT